MFQDVLSVQFFAPARENCATSFSRDLIGKVNIDKKASTRLFFLEKRRTFGKRSLIFCKHVIWRKSSRFRIGKNVVERGVIGNEKVRH